MASWVIVGAGYVGGVLAGRLAAAGEAVVVTRRVLAAAEATASAAGPAVRALALDLGDPRGLVAVPQGAIVVCCAPPGPDPAAELAGLASRAPARLVYVSSTGVYAPGGGAWVDEAWPTTPVTAAGRARLTAERALPAGALALRAAGIHGPGRGLLDRLRAGSYRIVGDGGAHVSRIHVVDLVDAIVRAGACSVAGAVNVADDDPAPIGLVADALAAHLGVPPPARVPIAAVDPEVAGMLAADRRITNARMKRELGVVLRYPSWRDVLAELGPTPA